MPKSPIHDSLQTLNARHRYGTPRLKVKKEAGVVGHQSRGSVESEFCKDEIKQNKKILKRILEVSKITFFITFFCQRPIGDRRNKIRILQYFQNNFR